MAEYLFNSAILGLVFPSRLDDSTTRPAARQPSGDWRWAGLLWLAASISLFAGGCRSWNQDSFRSLATVASVAAPNEVRVEQVSRNEWLDGARVWVLPWSKTGSEIDSRARDYLTRHGLYDRWLEKPADVMGLVAEQQLTNANLESAFTLSELGYRRAEFLRLRGERTRALGYYLQSVNTAYNFLFDSCYDQQRNAYDPIFRGICDLYNNSLEEALRLIHKSESLKPNVEYEIETATGSVKLAVRAQGRWAQERLSDFEFVRDFKSAGLTNSYRTFGLGVPLIATWDTQASQSPARPYYPPSNRIPLTAFLKVEPPGSLGEQAVSTLVLFDPLQQQNIMVDGHQAPLESDMTLPLAVLLQDPVLNNNLLGLFSMLDGNIAKEFSGLYMLEPYDPNKIPVMLVHGLASSPVTWTELYNDMRSDPSIRQNYQFWFYMYPTGQPFWVSARQMREDLQNVRQALDPNHNVAALDQMVCVGHSMGGLISRMQTIHSDNLFWQLVSDRPPEQLQGSDPARSDLLNTLFFEPNPSIRKVITVASPHLGSDFANDTTIWLSRSFFRLPDWLWQERQEVVKANPEFFRDPEMLEIATSIDSLSPDSPVFQAIQAARPARWVQYHNIFGVNEKRSPLSFLGNKVVGAGDGIVPVDSARAIDAVSELEIKDSHGEIHQNTLTILEIKRILRENMQQLQQNAERQVRENYGPAQRTGMLAPQPSHKPR